ncbi:MAG: hypothetical protein FJX46_01620 [Alphaproteobacteria bacterium]|nr:hypothetical protein [Alphaproteobacteria bacterium]
MRLTEDHAKAWLRGQGLPVPEGMAASSPAAVAEAAARFGGRVAVKALIPAGRRGKAGGVALATTPSEAEAAAAALLGRSIAGHAVERVYVERAVAIVREFYLGFAFGSILPRVMACREGGVEIEQVHRDSPAAIATRDIDPARGLRPWEATALWTEAGISGPLLPKLARLTASLGEAFRAGDALMLELNPIALDAAETLTLVGAMVEIDDAALFRHPEWQSLEAADLLQARNARERAVIAADRKFSGGAIRYTELDGDLALMVAGGGAGLVQHDLVVDLGGRPACHTDLSPAPTVDKPRALIDAMLSNPRVRGLLIGYNFLQMAPCDLVIEALVSVLREKAIDPRRFPIVVRLFGPKEAEARAIAATLPGIQYLPREASLSDAVRAALAAMAQRGPGS